MTTPLVVAPDPLAALPPHVRWLLERCKPDEPALEMVEPSLSIEGLYHEWMSGEQVPSAIRLIAALLPAREGVWWAWVSARFATQMPGGKAPTAAVHDALGAIEQWIVRPTDETCRAAWDAGNAAGLDTPVGLVSMAVFFSGRSIVPPNLPPIPPPPGVISPIVSGVIQVAAAANTDPLQIAPTMVAFAAQGLEIVKRLGGWETALQQAYELDKKQKLEYERATQPPATR